MPSNGDFDTLEKTLPKRCYVEPSFFQKERDGIFSLEWFCLGRASALAAPGDYRVVEHCGDSLLLVRGNDGELRAFHNLCRHRGSQLVPHRKDERPTGKFGTTIRCPYHSWCYDFSGRLRRTPHLKVDHSALGLHPISLALWGGFIFVRLRGDAKVDVESQLGPICQRVRRYPLSDLRIGHSFQYTVAANWKVLLENYNECYHCAGVHPELCQLVPTFRQGGSDLDWDRGIPHREGADTFTVTGTSTRESFPGLNEDERTRHKGELIYPNLMLSLSREHAAAYVLHPLAPDRTHITCDLLFHLTEMQKPSFDPSDAAEFWDLVNRQDWEICESVQRGMTSSQFDVGYYAPMEDASLDIREYVRRRVSPSDT